MLNKKISKWLFANLLLIVLIFPLRIASAQSYWSVGPKFGYTFGNHGGMMFGLEATFLPHSTDLTYGNLGFTFDADLGPEGLFKIHTGAEAAGLLGIDVGPTIYFRKGGFELGISIIPFAGAGIYPFYEWDIRFGATPNTTTLGSYFKLPLRTPVLQTAVYN